MKKLLKKATSGRLRDESRQLLVKLSQKWGISQADVCKLTICRAAEQEGVRQASEEE